MGLFPTGVTVVTARHGAEVLGMTASSVASLSLAPPMLLVCVGHSAEIHSALVAAPIFGVQVLAAGQEELALRFATRERQHFAAGEGRPGPAGLPLIDGALAHLECRRGEVFSAGDHTIVTGVVEWVETREGAPLCYFRSTYRSLAD